MTRFPGFNPLNALGRDSFTFPMLATPSGALTCNLLDCLIAICTGGEFRQPCENTRIFEVKLQIGVCATNHTVPHGLPFMQNGASSRTELVLTYGTGHCDVPALGVSNSVLLTLPRFLLPEGSPNFNAWHI
jgi:hypothetical protein